MKKLLLGLAAVLMSIAAMAQTDFRHITYKEALAAAKSENKMVFMDFYTDWCGPCKMMAREVFPQKEVGDFMNKHFVNIKVNAEKGEGVELAKKYAIKAYPTFIIISSDEKEVNRFVGYRNAETLVGKLSGMLDPTLSPEAIKKRYESGDRSALVVRTLASNELEALRTQRIDMDEYKRKSDSITSLVQDYFGGLSTADRLKDDNMFVYRTYTMSPFSPSGKFLSDNAAKFPQGVRAEVDSIVRNLYTGYVKALLTGDYKYDAANFKTLKQEIKKRGLDKDTDNSAAYAIIEAEGKGDKAAYIAACDKNFNKLSKEQQLYLVEGYASHFKGADDATKKSAAKFLRKYVGQLEPNGIYFTAMQIGELEGTNRHH